MKTNLFVCAAIATALVPAAAFADDPNDPTMSSRAARAHNRQIIRQLNLKELARVRERDARYAEGWRAVSGGSNSTSADPEFSRRSQEYDRATTDYVRERAVYERNLAQWRRAVAACRAGDYSACGN